MNKKKASIILQLVFFITVSILANDFSKKATMKVLYSVGDDDNLGADYIFGQLTYASVDYYGNIFVADKMDMQIRKFDANGKYLDRIGRRGRGPGEFSDISYLDIVDNDQLVVFDMLNARITFFDLNGKYLKENKIDFSLMLWPKAIEAFGKNYLVSTFIESEKEVLKIFDSSFVKSIQSFGSELYPKNLIERAGAGFFQPSVLKLNDTTLIYSSPFYDGYLKKYGKREGKWGYLNFAKGLVHTTETYEEVSSKIDDRKKYSFRSYNKGEKITARLNNESRGLFMMKNGNIIHFTLIKNKKRRIFGFELFNKELALINYYEILSEEIEANNAIDIPIRVVGIDMEDGFYIISSSEGIPIVKKVKIQY